MIYIGSTESIRQSMLGTLCRSTGPGIDTRVQKMLQNRARYEARGSDEPKIIQCGTAKSDWADPEEVE